MSKCSNWKEFSLEITLYKLKQIKSLKIIFYKYILSAIIAIESGHYVTHVLRLSGFWEDYKKCYFII